MNDEMSAFSIIKSVASRGLADQTKHEGDRVDGRGILICGKCGEPRQMFKSFPNPSKEDPQHRSTIKVVVMCRCEREEAAKKEKDREFAREYGKIQAIREASLMDNRFSTATFEVFRRTSHNDRNLRLCKRFAERFDLMMEKNQGLLFWGDVGTGKSFAAACIANYLLEKKIPVIMTSFVKLLDIASGKLGGDAILSRLSCAKLVIFDDLGAERGTDYALEKVYNIIDTRYRNKLPMILTTNLSIDDMKAEQDIRYSRIYDRILEVCYPMQFTGPSWRKREASRRYNEMEKLLEVDQA